jgi:hypothetical protein
MFRAILSFLGGPVIAGAINAYKAKIEASGKQDLVAERLAIREIEVQQREIEVQGEYKRALIGRWYEPTQLLGYIMVIYVGKVIIWDKVIGWGVTDPIGGAVGEWAGAIIMFLIGKRGIENVASVVSGALKRR